MHLFPIPFRVKGFCGGKVLSGTVFWNSHEGPFFLTIVTPVWFLYVLIFFFLIFGSLFLLTAGGALVYARRDGAPRPSTSEQAGRTPGTARCSEGRGTCIFSFPCPMTPGIGSCQPQAGPSYLFKKSIFYEFSFVFVLGVQKTVSMTYPCCLHYIITTIVIHFT